MGLRQSMLVLGEYSGRTTAYAKVDIALAVVGNCWDLLVLSDTADRQVI
jgi:hypothetical protein